MTTAALRSPTTGAVLVPDGPHVLAAAGERWPVVDGIPYLRTGREELIRATLGRLDAGDAEGALALLLADQDDWWDGAPPAPAALSALLRDRDRLSLRDAMAFLGFGRVGDYFAHRWSDPTFLAGLALIEAHWREPSSVFELACGIGHYLRELSLRGVAAVGGDVVFSKLWLARHWVVGREASLVCFDAGTPWPVAGRFDLVLCQDAFYFLDPKDAILDALRARTGPDGTLCVGHIHNRSAPNLSAGAGLLPSEVEELFPDAVTYDDDELTRALAEARAPRPSPLSALEDVEAFAVADGPGLLRVPRRLEGGLALPAPGATLARNPLYDGGEDGRSVAWPSDRYAREYGLRATYPARTELPPLPRAGASTLRSARLRELVALPERW